MGRLMSHDAHHQTSNASSVDRPLSPHLTIYKPQISSMLSIAHRLSGVALFVGLLFFVWYLVLSTYHGVEAFAFLTNSILGRFIMFLWSLAMYYHLYNGIRHLFWDAGMGYELTTMRKTGWLTIILTLVSTLITWALVLGSY